MEEWNLSYIFSLLNKSKTLESSEKQQQHETSWSDKVGQLGIVKVEQEQEQQSKSANENGWSTKPWGLVMVSRPFQHFNLSGREEKEEVLGKEE